jgi:hypothetical protein
MIVFDIAEYQETISAIFDAIQWGNLYEEDDGKFV